MTEGGAAMWSSDPTPGCISRRNKGSSLRRCMHPSVHGGTFCSGWNVGTAQVPISRQLARENVAYVYSQHCSAMGRSLVLPLRQHVWIWRVLCLVG